MKKRARKRDSWTGTARDPKVKRNINLNKRHVQFLLKQPYGGSRWIRDKIDEAIAAETMR